MLQASEIVDRFLLAHIPIDMVGLFEHDFGNGRSPAAAAHYGNFPVVHENDNLRVG